MYVALLALTLLIFAVVCVCFARSPAFGFFHPLTIYLAFHGLVFTLRPLLSYHYGYSAIYDLYEFTPDAYAKAMALVAANLGLICFAAASLYFGDAPLRSRFDVFAQREATAMMRPLAALLVAMVPLLAYATYLAWGQRSGAIVDVVSDLRTGVTISTAGEGYTQNAQLFATALVAIFAWLGRFRLWSLVPAALFVLARAGSGGRGPIIAMLVVLGALWLHERRRSFPDWRTIALIVPAAGLFSSVGADRGYGVRTLFTGESSPYVLTERPLAPLEAMDTGNLEFLEYLTDKVPRDTGTFEYFVDNLQLITEPVPRVLWKGKPIGQPVRLFNLFDYGFPIGMTRSLPGEGWVQLGLAGVALWCSAWGALLGWTYNLFARSRQSVLQTALYVTLLGCLTVFYRDGMLLTLVKQLFFFMFPVLVWAGLAAAIGVPRAADFRRLVASRLAGRRRAAREEPGDEGPGPTIPRSQRRRAAGRPLPHG